jgi:16S rRNA A1518/A1519 N6-dimethyltransferase RsmA/KsgA/DIM1 with predicted DNA glycosylase/AP lyase activity
VLRLMPLEAPLVTPAEQGSFRRLVVGLFGFRRKQIGRGLRELTGWDTGRVSSILARVGIASDVRPEVLAPEAYVGLLRALVDGGWTAR